MNILAIDKCFQHIRILFVIAFIFYQKILFFLSASFLLVGLVYFSFIALKELFKVPNKTYIVKGIITSLLFLNLAFLIAIHLIVSHATSNISELHYNIVALHYNYIFFGFIFLLIVSISFQVVPMFWVADNYSQNEQKYILYITSILLVLYPINIFLELNLEILYKLIISIISIYFAYLTIKKLKNRKRKLKDISIYFYTTSMIFLIIGIAYWIGLSFFDLPISILAILLGLGFVATLMNGMLYKIVPFLTWFHLTSSGNFNVPTMRDMIGTKKTEQQFWVHFTSIILFCIGFLFQFNIIIKLGAILFIISNILFFINIFKASRNYTKTQDN